MAVEAYFIDRLVALIRENTDEPSAGAKYDTDSLLRRIKGISQEVITELNALADNPVYGRINISFAQGTDTYILPPNVSSIERIGRLNSLTGLPEGILWLRSKRNPYGPVFRLEGQTLRMDPKWLGATTEYEMLYIPNGNFEFHYGTAAGSTTTTLTLAATPTAGARDTRQNAYVGSTVRIITDDGNIVQERNVTGYVNSTRVITVSPAFNPTLAGTITYEIIPSYWHFLERVISFKVALDLVAIEGNPRRVAGLTTLLRNSMRSARLELNRMENIKGNMTEADTIPGRLGSRLPFSVGGGGAL
jgi:DNA/RNA endonuclease YhcR with UshA esterase domain